MGVATKKCNKCGSYGPFYRDKSRVDGLSYCCKKCELKRTQKYKDENIQDYKDQSRQYRLKNPEKVRAYKRVWSKKNRHRMYEYERRYLERHPEQREKKRERQRKTDLRPERREQKLKARLKRFGLTPESYKALFEKQGGKCAICGDTDPKMSSARRLPVDHCHKTNKVRGLLCAFCNSMLGYACERIDVLLAAVEYLRKHQ